MYIKRYSYKDICHSLTAKGYTTRNGKPFGKNSLYDIIGNEKYCGIYTFNKIPKDNGKRNSHSKKRPADFIRIEDAIPAIISKEIFQQAQARRRSNKDKPAEYKAKVNYLLRGKIICGHCGSAMGGHTCTPRDKSYSYYSCLDKERIPTKKCLQKQIRKEDAEEAVITKIKNEILTSETFSVIADKMRQKFANTKNSIDKKIADKQNQLTKAQKTRVNLYKLVEKGIDDDFTFNKIRAAKETIDILEAEIQTLKKSKKSKILSDTEIQKAFQFFNKKINDMSDVEAKKLLIDLFLDKAIVTDQKLDIQLSTNAITNMIQK